MTIVVLMYHYGMTSFNLDDGRVNQKWRTRQALLRAAGQLLQEGKPLTVADVADAARVSRTTAYRYFGNQDTLQGWAPLAVLAEPDLADLIAAAEAPGPPEQRVERVIDRDQEMTKRIETAFRIMLRASLATAPQDGSPKRPAHRVQWLEQALGEYRPVLGEEAFARLVYAIALCTGIESLIVLQDVCGLRTEDARAVKQWASQALIAQALADAGARAPAATDATNA